MLGVFARRTNVCKNAENGEIFEKNQIQQETKRAKYLYFQQKRNVLFCDNVHNWCDLLTRRGINDNISKEFTGAVCPFVGCCPGIKKLKRMSFILIKLLLV